MERETQRTMKRKPLIPTADIDVYFKCMHRRRKRALLAIVDIIGAFNRRSRGILLRLLITL